MSEAISDGCVLFPSSVLSFRNCSSRADTYSPPVSSPSSSCSKDLSSRLSIHLLSVSVSSDFGWSLLDMLWSQIEFVIEIVVIFFLRVKRLLLLWSHFIYQIYSHQYQLLPPIHAILSLKPQFHHSSFSRRYSPWQFNVQSPMNGKFKGLAFAISGQVMDRGSILRSGCHGKSTNFRSCTVPTSCLASLIVFLLWLLVPSLPVVNIASYWINFLKIW